MENIWTKASNLISTFGFIPTELLDEVILENSKSRTIENGLSLFEVIRLASGVEWMSNPVNSPGAVLYIWGRSWRNGRKDQGLQDIQG